MVSKTNIHLKDVASFLNRGVAPSYTDNGGIVVLNQKCIRNETVNFTQARRTDISRKAISKNKYLQINDILVNSTGVGTLGRVAQIKVLSEPATVDSHITIVRPDPGLVHPEYLGVSLRARQVEIENLAEGSTGQTELSRYKLAELNLNLPPFSEQKCIAQILGTLDDKINLNRRINQTLEAMAQAIFKSWFVDFDPVRAKIAAIEQGQDPLRAAMRAISGKTDAELDQLPREHHHPLAVTAALFPDAMEESELGEIPEGWQIQPLDRIANYLNGLALQKFPPESESEFLPVIKIAQLRAKNTNGADRASARLKLEYIVEDGDVLFSWSGSLEVDVWTDGAGALNQHLFKVTSTHVPKWFYYFATKHYLPQFREIAKNKATTMGHIQRKHLSDAEITLPKPDVLRSASKVISPIFNQVIALRLQSRKLSELRDTLLPKLLSGELSVENLSAEDVH